MEEEELVLHAFHKRDSLKHRSLTQVSESANGGKAQLKCGGPEVGEASCMNTGLLVQTPEPTGSSATACLHPDHHTGVLEPLLLLQ